MLQVERGLAIIGGIKRGMGDRESGRDGGESVVILRMIHTWRDWP